jgi:hypothetical protein
MKTEDLNAAELYLYNYLQGLGITPRIGQIKDFRLDENESDSEIEKFAEEFICEEHTERCYAKSAIKNGYDQY